MPQPAENSNSSPAGVKPFHLAMAEWLVRWRNWLLGASIVLTIIALINTVIGAYYYLRVLVMMYMREPGEAAKEAAPLSGGLRAALILPALGTLVLGIFPSWVLDFAGRSANLVK